MKISNISIANQLQITFGIILAGVGVLALVAWFHAVNIWESTQSMYEHPLETRIALREITSNVLNMRVKIRDFLLIEDTSLQNTMLNELAVNQLNVYEQIQKLELCYLGPPDELVQLKKEFAYWISIRTESVRLARTGNHEEARQRHLPGGIAPVQADKVLSIIQKISDFALLKGDEFYVSAQEHKDSLQTRLLWVIFFVVVVSMLVLYALARGINKPLKEIISVTQTYRKGKFNLRSNYSSRNEFGLLSDSINNLAETVEKEMSLSEQTVALSAIMLSEREAHAFSRSLLKNLLAISGGQMGAFYLLNEEKDEFEHFECIGMNAEACKPFSASRLEGEFGLSLADKTINHISRIDEKSRFSFKAVAGSFIPSEIITVPILSGDKVIAMISLAKLSEFNDQSIRLIQNIHNTMCARVEGVMVFHKLVEFSHLLEEKNKTLEIQRLELAQKSATLTEANNELEAQKQELSVQASELTKQNIELEIQKKQLGEVNKLKTSFLSNMSHELRTPLNSVIALSGVLNRRLSGKVPEEEYGYLDVIERNGKHLLALINDILDPSRIESGRQEIEILEFRPADLINEVVEMIHPQAVAKNIKLEVTPFSGIPAMHSDYGKCVHILQNLIANAVKFTDEGGVTINAELKNNDLIINVKDTGIGIAEKHLQEIFDEFRQADESHSRRKGGTGLGLAIAKKYAELLGGHIRVESTLGKGSEFSLVLPIRFTQSIEIHDGINPSFGRKLSSEIPKRKKPMRKGKTILLVEDSEAIVVQMKDFLETEGFQLMIARNGQEALDLIKEHQPDGMILDLMMPKVDGFEVLRHIRAEKQTEKLPVIILTAKIINKEELAFLQHNHVYQLVQKGGINRENLLKIVEQMLEDQPAEGPEPAEPTLLRDSVILIVEDNPDNMVTFKAVLSDTYKLLEAVDGKQGLEMAQQYQPDLILMDIALPVMNGIEALDEIRKDANISTTPVIAVSASAMKGDKEDFIQCGFNQYLSKPIDPEMLLKAIKLLLHKNNSK